MPRPSPHPSGPLPPETVAAIEGLEIRVRRVVEGLLGGAHPSLHRGASIEFAEHKKYVPGDDPRHIDWHALARTDRLFVKQHQREVSLRAVLMLDRSASMAYRGRRAPHDKATHAVILLAALAHLLVRQGDAAGLITFAEGPDGFIPPRRRADHLAALMGLLAQARPAPSGSTGYAAAVARAVEVAQGRSLIAIGTDLWGAGDEDRAALRRLAARGHDVVVFHVLDPDEVDLPFDGPATFRGPEGEGEVDADPALMRDDYRQSMRRVQESWRRFAAEAGIDLLTALTTEPPAAALAELVSRRRGGGRTR